LVEVRNLLEDCAHSIFAEFQAFRTLGLGSLHDRRRSLLNFYDVSISIVTLDTVAILAHPLFGELTIVHVRVPWIAGRC
jgi:hypothetical protein